MGIEQRIEDARRFAKFMGCTYEHETYFEDDKDIDTMIVEKWSRPSFIDDRLYRMFGWCSYENLGDMRYYNSWEWLIPVIQKIGEMGKNPTAELLNWVRNNKTIFDIKLIDVTFEEAYRLTLEFIEWYNNQK